MLEVEGIHVHYGRIAAVRGVSLSVNEGEIVTLVGPNGAGKSTTMMTIAGALAPTRGAIKLDGASLVGKSPENLARLGVSFVPEGRHVFSQLTVDENVRIGSDMRRDRQNIAGDFERVMGYFPFLRGRLSTPGGKLSGGEQQQLVIARALMTRPRIMLIDEPSLGLAPIIVDRVYEILRCAAQRGQHTARGGTEHASRTRECGSHLRDAERTDRAARPQQGSYRQGTGTRLFRLR